MNKRLALTKEGKLTYCTASEENIGKGRCNHIAHQKNNETAEEFTKRINQKPKELKRKMTKEDNIILAKRMIVDNVYRSARLEGIGTTYAETEDILNNKGCANLRADEVTTIINLKRAWEFSLDEKNLNRDIDFSLMQDLHEILGRGLETLRWNEIGKFRTDGVHIGGTNWRPSLPNPEKMWNELIELKKEENIVERAMNIHLWCCKTQAFKDCNKRVAGFLANHELIKNATGIFSVPDTKYNKYKELLVRYYETNEDKEIKEFIYNYCYIYDSEGLPFIVE